MERTNKIMLIAISLMIMGCSVKMSEVKIKPPLQYNLCQEQNGLKVAVDPFFEKERMENFFGTDMLSYGILPVLVVIENNHSNSGFLFQKTYFSIAIKGENSDTKSGTDATIPKNQKILDLEKNPELAVAMGVISVVAPGIVLSLTPLMMYEDIKRINIMKKNYNMMMKAFIDKTIFPKESHSGFLYFQVKDQQVIRNVVAIIVKTKNTLTDEELRFVFQIVK
jgi:hypothetical protein